MLFIAILIKSAICRVFPDPVTYTCIHTVPSDASCNAHLLGMRVGCVAVEDADSAELTELRLSIAGGNEREKFAIDSISGCITTVAGIDREEVAVYNLLIEVNKLKLHGNASC